MGLLEGRGKSNLVTKGGEKKISAMEEEQKEYERNRERERERENTARRKRDCVKHARTHSRIQNATCARAIH